MICSREQAGRRVGDLVKFTEDCGCYPLLNPVPEVESGWDKGVDEGCSGRGGE